MFSSYRVALLIVASFMASLSHAWSINGHLFGKFAFLIFRHLSLASRFLLSDVT